jgi:hypothetical protein
VLPIFGRIIIENQHEIFVFGQTVHRAWIFRAEPFNTIIKCFVSFFSGFCLLDIMQGFLDLGLHGFRQFLHDIGGLMHPAELLISFRPELGTAFRNPRAPSPTANLGAFSSPGCFKSVNTSSQLAADSW